MNQTMNILLLHNFVRFPKFVRRQRIMNNYCAKGKLHCPRCQSKIGSFDFIGDQSQISPIHLMKNKVDAFGELLSKEDSK